MAFLPHRHLSLYIFMIIPLYPSINANSIKPPYPNLPSFNCGTSFFRYPFWQQHEQNLQHSGYHGLGLLCTNQTPFLNLSNILYHVENINYSQNTLTLTCSETTTSNKICPMSLHSVSINTSTSSVLNYSIDNKMLYIFYNCTIYPPSFEHVKCLQYGAKHTYVFLEGAIPEFDWRGHCESTLNIPVTEKALENVTDLALGFGGVIQGGFKMEWQPADGACQLCEGSGGFCGYDHFSTSDRKFVCYCGQGRHLANCHKKGLISQKFNTNFAAMGAMILVASITLALTIFHFIQKKRGTQKRGFTQIPNVGK